MKINNPLLTGKQLCEIFQNSVNAGGGFDVELYDLIGKLIMREYDVALYISKLTNTAEIYKIYNVIKQYKNV